MKPTKEKGKSFTALNKKALWSQYSEIATTIVENKGQTKRKTARAELFQYATQGTLTKLDQAFLTLAQDHINDTDKTGDNLTPLMLAAKNGHDKVVGQLLKVGNADVDKKAAWNESTALMVAAEAGHDKVVETLIDLHANVNLCNSVHNSALMLASELGNKDVVRVLLMQQEVIDKDTKNRYEDTALILAASNGHEECVDLLIDAKADLNLVNKFGKTALVLSAENGFVDIVHSLVCAGANVNLVSKRGLSAIMLAAAKAHYDIVKLLSQYGADIHQENKDRTDNVLTYACFGGHKEIIVHLINLGADVNYQNINGDTVLMRACEHGNKETIDMLLSTYTRQDILTALMVQNKEGLTCLMKACRTGNLKIIVYLLNLLRNQLRDLGSDRINGPTANSSMVDAGNRGSGSGGGIGGGSGGGSGSGGAADVDNRFNTLFAHPSLAKCVVHGDYTRAGMFKAYYAALENHDGDTASSNPNPNPNPSPKPNLNPSQPPSLPPPGDTASSLLFDYFLMEHSSLQSYRAFEDFVCTATASTHTMYLLDLLPLHTIIPKFENPTAVLNAIKEPLFRNLAGDPLPAIYIPTS